MSCAPENRRLVGQSVTWTLGIAATVGATALAHYGVCKAFQGSYERALAMVDPEAVSLFEAKQRLSGMVSDLRQAWRFGQGRVHPNFEAFWSGVEANGSYYGELAEHAAAIGKSVADVKDWVSLPVLRPWPQELRAIDPRPVRGGYVVGAIFSSLGILGVSGGGVTTVACIAYCRAGED